MGATQQRLSVLSVWSFDSVIIFNRITSVKLLLKFQIEAEKSLSS